MLAHVQKQFSAQKKDAASVSSILDSSSQSESLQRKADIANNATQRAEAPRPNNTGMPDNLKSGIESLSGFSMDDVRVHYNSSKPATVQALAYTQGTDIHVAPGQEKHLPHEAWHVAQQMAGRVSPTTNINDMPVNDNAGLEHEADVMGEKATMQCKGDGKMRNVLNESSCYQLFTLVHKTLVPPIIATVKDFVDFLKGRDGDYDGWKCKAGFSFIALQRLKDQCSEIVKKSEECPEILELPIEDRDSFESVYNKIKSWVTPTSPTEDLNLQKSREAATRACADIQKDGKKFAQVVDFGSYAIVVVLDEDDSEDAETALKKAEDRGNGTRNYGQSGLKQVNQGYELKDYTSDGRLISKNVTVHRNPTTGVMYEVAEFSSPQKHVRAAALIQQIKEKVIVEDLE